MLTYVSVIRSTETLRFVKSQDVLFPTRCNALLIDNSVTDIRKDFLFFIISVQKITLACTRLKQNKYLILLLCLSESTPGFYDMNLCPEKIYATFCCCLTHCHRFLFFPSKYRFPYRLRNSHVPCSDLSVFCRYKMKTMKTFSDINIIEHQ